MTPGQAQAARRCPRRRKPRLRSPQNPQGPHKVCKRLIALDGYAKRRETEASRASSRCTAARRRLPHGRRGRLVVYVPPGGVSPLDYQQARDGRGGLGARRAALTGTRTKRRAPRTPRGTSGLFFLRERRDANRPCAAPNAGRDLTSASSSTAIQRPADRSSGWSTAPRASSGARHTWSRRSATPTSCVRARQPYARGRRHRPSGRRRSPRVRTASTAHRSSRSRASSTPSAPTAHAPSARRKPHFSSTRIEPTFCVATYA